jgi:hypothetical protein
MSEERWILSDLCQVTKNLRQNPVAKLDEFNTVLLIVATKKEIENTTDDKLKDDYQWLLNELEVHYKELSRKTLLQNKVIVD